MTYKGKIINDPIYGFMQFPEEEVMALISDPYFQRLRAIKQMGMAHLVYPGAVHTRFHHSLGACHLMGEALTHLRNKGVPVSEKDYIAARLAILLHDIGHGPFSHALEHSLVAHVDHEFFSELIMSLLNKKMNGMLDTTISIFNDAHPSHFLHQLVSGQLDVDRMDYLNRDSFYTGVSEGIIGYDRILQMLNVVNEELLIEAKAIHSVEKFIIARRLMYWQVYLHKAVISAENLLINILRRAKELVQSGEQLFATPVFSHFLNKQFLKEDFINNTGNLELFCQLDDSDIFVSVKAWRHHKDFILSTLCNSMLNRKLYKTILSPNSLSESYAILKEKYKNFFLQNGIAASEEHYFVFKGKTSNNTYDKQYDGIKVLYKTGDIKDISEVDDPLINRSTIKPVVKNYISYLEL